VCNKTSFWLHWEQLPVLDVSFPKILKLIYISIKKISDSYLFRPLQHGIRVRGCQHIKPLYLVLGLLMKYYILKKKTRTKMVRASLLQFI